MCVCTVEEGKVRRCSRHDAAEDYLERLIASQNENVHLQERVEEADRENEWLVRSRRFYVQLQKQRDDLQAKAMTLREERDGYKALAERFATSLHYKDVHELPFKSCPYRICQEARAAIEGGEHELFRVP